MFIGLLSEACMHCIFADQVLNKHELRVRMESLAGTQCPDCSKAVGGIDLMVISEDLQIARNPDSEWHVTVSSSQRIEEIHSAPALELRYQAQSGAAAQLMSQVRSARESETRNIRNAITELVAVQYGVARGRTLRERGDLDGALIAFEHALERGRYGNKDAAAAELAQLGLQLERINAVQKAKRAYKSALVPASGEARAMIAYSLGSLLQVEGDLDEAEENLQQARASTMPFVAADASFRLGQIEHLHRNAEPDSLERALAHYQMATTVEGAEYEAAKAFYNIGFIWESRGKLDLALRAWEAASKSGKSKNAEAVQLARAKIKEISEDGGARSRAKGWRRWFH